MATNDDKGTGQGRTFKTSAGKAMQADLVKMLNEKSFKDHKDPGHLRAVEKAFNAYRRLHRRSTGLGAILEDLPEPHNRVTLDPVLKDGNGIPAPRIDYTLSENAAPTSCGRQAPTMSRVDCKTAAAGT